MAKALINELFGQGLMWVSLATKGHGTSVRNLESLRSSQNQGQHHYFPPICIDIHSYLATITCHKLININNHNYLTTFIDNWLTVMCIAPKYFSRANNINYHSLFIPWYMYVCLEFLCLHKFSEMRNINYFGDFQYWNSVDSILNLWCTISRRILEVVTIRPISQSKS